MSKTYLKKKSYYFKAYIHVLLVQKLTNESNKFNQYQRFTVDNIHSYQTLWFYCFKIEYDIIEEFEKEKSYSKLLY